MDLENINQCIYLVFSNLGIELETARVSMFAIDNIYSYPPFFRYRIKGIEKSDTIYVQLKKIVEEFKGNTEWTVVTREDVRNFVIIQQSFSKFILHPGKFNKAHITTIINESKYTRLIDYAIMDIPKLADYIYNKLKR